MSNVLNTEINPNETLSGELESESYLIGVVDSDQQLVGEVNSESTLSGIVTSDTQIIVNVDSIGSVGGIGGSFYIHPDSHPASMIIEDRIRKFVTIDEKMDIQGLKERESFVHDQMVSSNEWIINHGLKKYPSITVVDSSGSVVIGEIIYTSLNEVTVTFMSEFSGKAYFN